jgi:hypothetical protein
MHAARNAGPAGCRPSAQALHRPAALGLASAAHPAVHAHRAPAAPDTPAAPAHRRAPPPAAGEWHGQVVAVKVISHTDLEEERIQREVQLHTSFDHPNVVKALHYAKINLGASETGSDKVRRLRAYFCPCPWASPCPCAGLPAPVQGSLPLCRPLPLPLPPRGPAHHRHGPPPRCSWPPPRARCPGPPPSSSCPAAAQRWAPPRPPSLSPPASALPAAWSTWRRGSCRCAGRWPAAGGGSATLLLRGTALPVRQCSGPRRPARCCCTHLRHQVKPSGQAPPAHTASALAPCAPTQELCDQGPLSRAVQHKRFCHPDDTPDMVRGLMGTGPASPRPRCRPACTRHLLRAASRARTSLPPLHHPPQRAILLRALDVARGMAYLHSVNICHGDLKVRRRLLPLPLPLPRPPAGAPSRRPAPPPPAQPAPAAAAEPGPTTPPRRRRPPHAVRERAAQGRAGRRVRPDCKGRHPAGAAPPASASPAAAALRSSAACCCAWPPAPLRPDPRIPPAAAAPHRRWPILA